MEAIQVLQEETITGSVKAQTTENGEKNFTFSPPNPKLEQLVAQKPANSLLPPPPEPSRRKCPPKLWKDRVKWVSWLQRKLEETRREKLPAQSRLEATLAAPVPRFAPVCVQQRWFASAGN